MISSARTIPSNGQDSAALFDLGAVSELLLADAGISWPRGTHPTDVRVERAWPLRDGSFSFEFSFALGASARHSIYCAGEPLPPPHADIATERQAVVTAFGLRGVSVSVSSWGVRVHTIERDPALTHLAECVDSIAMTERLAAHWDTSGHDQPSADHPVECRPLGYRAARRAAIGYNRSSPSGCAQRLMGKTYIDDRGARLLELHVAVNRELAVQTDGRVRVPVPVAYIADLRMGLFQWARGTDADRRRVSLSAIAAMSAEALAAMHGISIDGLPEWTIADEQRTVNRWHIAMCTAAPDLAEGSALLAEALAALAETVEVDRVCTVHRDFYEQQLIRGRSTTTILDLDTLAIGHPSIDVGNLLAHLFLAERMTTGAPATFESLGRIVLSHYRDHWGKLNERVLMYHWASALYRVGAVHSLRTLGRAHTPALWGLAADLLARGESDGLRSSEAAAVFAPPLSSEVFGAME
ncbi:MAG: phosphotransferase [Planctomycetes bacterium]|nr:phosphotransferase [Planctomycetota bacterium]